MTQQPTLSSAGWEVKECYFPTVLGWDPPETYRRRGGEVQREVRYLADPGAPFPETFLPGCVDCRLEIERCVNGGTREWYVAWKPLVTDKEFDSYRLALLLDEMVSRGH